MTSETNPRRFPKERGEVRRKLFSIQSAQIPQSADIPRPGVSTSKGNLGKDLGGGLGVPAPEAAAPLTETGKGGAGKPPEGKELSAASEMPRGIEVRLGESFPIFPEGLTQRVTLSRQQFPDYRSFPTLVAPTGDHLIFSIGQIPHL